MPTVQVPVHPLTQPLRPPASPMQTRAKMPPACKWLTHFTNANNYRASQQDSNDFPVFAGLHRPEDFRTVTRAHVIAWREALGKQALAHDTMRRNLAAPSSLDADRCERHAVWDHPVLGVKRLHSMNREGVTPALGDHQARILLEAPAADTLKGQRDRAILATLLYHGLRCEELCTLRVGGIR
jgi:site-specific recombinase XerD